MTYSMVLEWRLILMEVPIPANSTKGESMEQGNSRLLRETSLSAHLSTTKDRGAASGPTEMVWCVKANT